MKTVLQYQLLFSTLITQFAAIIAIPQSQQNKSSYNNLEDLSALKNTAGYNGACDPKFYLSHNQPIYSAKTLEEAWEAKVALQTYLEKNPHHANLSCYGIAANNNNNNPVTTDAVVAEEKYLQCETCQEETNTTKAHFCCRCLQTYPYILDKKPHHPALCQPREILAGDKCNYNRSQEIKTRIHDPFFEALGKAKTRKEYVNALVLYVDALGNLWQPPELRWACLTESNDMECKPDGKCDCVDDGLYRRYQRAPDGRHCVGKKESICHLMLTTQTASFERIAACEEQLECQPAVSGLFCNNFDDPNCVFRVEYEDNATERVFLWNIRACGGRWGDKLELPVRLLVNTNNYSSKLYSSDVAIFLLYSLCAAFCQTSTHLITRNLNTIFT